MKIQTEKTDFDKENLTEGQTVIMKKDLFSIGQDVFTFCREPGAEKYRSRYNDCNGIQTKITCVSSRNFNGQIIKVYGIKHLDYVVHPDMIAAVVEEEDIDVDYESMI